MTNDRTDAFESAVQKIARRKPKKNGDPVTLEDIWDRLEDHWDLTIAVDKDGQTRDLRKVEMIEHMDARLKAVEDAQAVCRDGVRTLIANEHDARHAEHMAKHHPPDKERMDWLVDLTAGKLAGVFWVVLGGLIVIVANYLIFGHP